MKKALMLAACAILTGCAGLDCGSDWYATGQRDGRIGAEHQIENYAARCGGNVDRTRYAEGWQEGWAQRPRISSF